MENCNPVATPMEKGAMAFMILYEKQATKDEIEDYQSKVGSEMFASM
jgi:hypothetical protein